MNTYHTMTSGSANSPSRPHQTRFAKEFLSLPTNSEPMNIEENSAMGSSGLMNPERPRYRTNGPSPNENLHGTLSSHVNTVQSPNEDPSQFRPDRGHVIRNTVSNSSDRHNNSS